MKLRAIINKALKGEELNALERAELERFDPEALETRAVNAETLLKEAQEKLDAAEQDKMTEAEKLKKRLSQMEEKLKASEDAGKLAENDRDEARQELAALIRKNRIGELAAKHKCEDPEYLDFLAQKRGVDLNDEAKAADFMESLKKEAPKYFAADVKSGAEIPPAKPQQENNVRAGDRIGAIMQSLNNAPEVQ